MSRSRGREPFQRLEDGRIALDLPPGVREFMIAAAQRLRETGGTPGSSGFDRLFGHIDESADLDDPAYVLARQLAIDEVVELVAASAEKDLIDPEEAEAWLKVLGMTLSRLSAELGIVTEADRAELAAQDEAVVRVIYALEVGLIDALDQSD
ncbi:MAG TPA: hypothetical protein VKR78_03745 [Acidimicrobiales bacterium]|nr:hypothetical protein [Acidimicrobiales bacterium]